MTVGEGLKRFRHELNLTQKELASTIGLHQQAYQRYEVGKTLPLVTVLIKIADTYGVSVDYLLGRCESPHAQNPTANALAS